MKIIYSLIYSCVQYEMSHVLGHKISVFVTYVTIFFHLVICDPGADLCRLQGRNVDHRGQTGEFFFYQDWSTKSLASCNGF